ncbi:sodium-dependent transporter [Clostridium algidicarnis]|uniref:sodium-dependent transporter n=1 Tax=Clostridium algidicarnis TaxID=37659 RepID=UPI001C0AEDD1|nr:sodium-dependent transporter [Clostridium algidicarnis]MBU3196398.1 sodium-dependent transporter [Clostridium algidicarnis]
MKDLNNRESFSSGMAIFFATLSSAVGLGNIWKFPYLIGSNGGGAFLIVYLCCILLVGIPIMISEFYIGRKTKKNIVGAIKTIKGESKWQHMGIIGVVTAYLILFFYSSVGGWVYSYVFKSIKGDFKNINGDIANIAFKNTIIGPIEPILWQVLVVVVVSIIIYLGVGEGIEKVTKTLMPLLFVLIIICDIRALMLPNASEGLEFLFKPNFSLLTKDAFLVALGLSFFKLSLGVGTMVTYSSYFREDNNMIGTSLKVALSDTLVSILAGIAIFPAVFSFGLKPEAGPGLLFLTIPLVFSKIPFGQVMLVAFFVLSSIAATTAMMSMLEVLIAYYTEEKSMSRKKAVIINALIIICIGVFATLSADSEGLLGGITIFGKGIFDIFDYLSSNILMPIGGFLIIILVGYYSKKQSIINELSNKGELNNIKLIKLYYFVIRYISPIFLLLIFFYSIGIIK